MSEYAAFDHTLETDEQKERRLAREARERLGTLTHDEIPGKTGYSVKVEVSYQADDHSPERAGYFVVMLPIDRDPGEAGAVAEAELNRRYPEAEYVSVDDVLSY